MSASAHSEQSAGVPRASRALASCQQGVAKVATEKKNRGQRAPSFSPLRCLCLVGYYTLMRPDNNRSLDWERSRS